MHKFFKWCCAFIWLSISLSTFAAQSYEATYVCAASPNLTSTTYVHADSDGQALQLANEYIRNNTADRNRGCRVTAVRGGNSSSSSSSREERYEVQYQCAANRNLTHTTYVSATNETQAALAGKSYIDNNTADRNKGCQVTSVRK